MPRAMVHPTLEVNMVRRNMIFGMASAGLLILAGWSSYAEEEMDPAALAKVLPQASVTLEHGLKAGEQMGLPISAKFEIEHGALQLSVYTSKDGKFSEVIVNHVTGAIDKSQPIDDSEDLQDAKAQNEAMAKGWMGLDAALAKTREANAGYRAVSIEPVLKGGHAFAHIVFMKGADVRKVSEPLY
jgi:hypothetical protein